ncbi:hypothetical protein SK128_027802 [Halocaridina rubra]|uniref:Uncharacterized protein n=1 Tax=Halocaridina rubra TaxID=373956 RepID=A0AAN8X5G4_HALRR
MFEIQTQPSKEDERNNVEPQREIIIMEDLRQHGFKMYDRRKGMDNAHTVLVMEELARLHAASLLLHAAEGYQTVYNHHDFLTKDWLR